MKIVSIQQLEQLNRLLEVARKYLPADGLTTDQMHQRSQIIVRAVSQLRVGLSDEALDDIIRELKQII